MIKFSTLRKKITILLVILLAVFYSLPVEAHLKICIGEDGHFDVEAVACRTKSLANQPGTINAIDDHHKECIDFGTTCADNAECKTFLFSPNRKNQRDGSQTLANIFVKTEEAFFSFPVQRLSILSFSNLKTKNNPLLTLRTVVLLI